MRKIGGIAAVLLWLCGCNSNRYTIEGRIEGLEGKVYLFSADELLDSAKVRNGTFRFKGTAEAPEIRFLSGSDNDGNAFSAMLTLEPGAIRVESDPEIPGRIIVTGTPTNATREEFEKRQTALIGEFHDPETSEERRKAIEAEIHALHSQTRENDRPAD